MWCPTEVKPGQREHFIYQICEFLYMFYYFMCIRTELTLSLPAWCRVAGLLASLSPVDFWIFQMWQEEEVLVMEDVLLLEDSDSEMFLTAEGGLICWWGRRGLSDVGEGEAGGGRGPRP